jgi:hypothetical protein
LRITAPPVPAALSNSEMVPSGRNRASCCQPKRAAAGAEKLLRLPPRRQMISPRGLIL